MAAGNAVIGALRVNLGLDSAQFQDGLKDASDRLYKFKAVAAGVLAVVASAAVTASIGLGIAAKRAIDVADDMAKASQKFGVPIEALTRLKHVADLSGVSMEGLGTGLRKLAQSMDETASKGTGRAADAFKSLGIEVETADGHLRSQQDVLTDLAAKFSGMKDGAEKTALAMSIFGRSGADLIPILNSGAAGLREMMQEADDLGLVIDQKTGKAAEAFNDNLTRLGRVWDGLVTKLAAKLLPHLEMLSEAFLGFARDQAQVDGALDAIVSAFKWITEAAARAAAAVKLLGADLSWLVNTAVALGKWDINEMLALDAQHAEALKQYRQEMEGISRLWSALPDASGGLGKSFGTGWTSPGSDGTPGSYSGPSDADQRAAEEAARDSERLQAKIDRLRESLMTEQEIEDAVYQERLAKLAEFEEARGGMLADSAELRAKIEADYNDRVARLQEQRLNDFGSIMGSAGSMIESLTKIMGKEGDKQFGIVKALSLAEALINVYTGITAALRLPFPANIAAAAQVAAQGFATLAAMKSVSKSSSSASAATGGGGSSGASAPAEAAAPQTFYLSGVQSNRNYSGEEIRNLVEALNKAHGDGYRLKVA